MKPRQGSPGASLDSKKNIYFVPLVPGKNGVSCSFRLHRGQHWTWEVQGHKVSHLTLKTIYSRYLECVSDWPEYIVFCGRQWAWVWQIQGQKVPHWTQWIMYRRDLKGQRTNGILSSLLLVFLFFSI